MDMKGPHSNEHANQWLLQKLKENVNAKSAVYSFSAAQYALEELCSVPILGALFASGCTLVGYYVIGSLHFIVEFSFLLLNIIINVVFALWMRYLTETELSRIVHHRLSTLEFGTKSRREILEVKRPNAATFITTLRDDKYIKMPPNLLIEGDFIRLSSGEEAPTNIELVSEPQSQVDEEDNAKNSVGENTAQRHDSSSNNQSVLEPGRRRERVNDVKSPLRNVLIKRGQRVHAYDKNGPNIYRVLETPAINQIEEVFKERGSSRAASIRTTWLGLRIDRRRPLAQNPNDMNNVPQNQEEQQENLNNSPYKVREYGSPVSTFDGQVQKAASFLASFGAIAFALSLVITAIRVSTLWKSLKATDIIFEFLIRHTLLLLPCLPLSSPVFFALLDAFGNAVLYSHAKNPPSSVSGVGGGPNNRHNTTNVNTMNNNITNNTNNANDNNNNNVINNIDVDAGEHHILDMDDDEELLSSFSSGSDGFERKEHFAGLDEHLARAFRTRTIPNGVSSVTLDILKGRHAHVTISVNPFTVLGNITVKEKITIHV